MRFAKPHWPQYPNDLLQLRAPDPPPATAGLSRALTQTLTLNPNPQGCRGLFATHYHHLSDVHAVDPKVQVAHMACCVLGQDDADGLGALASDKQSKDKQQQVRGPKDWSSSLRPSTSLMPSARR